MVGARLWFGADAGHAAHFAGASVELCQVVKEAVVTGGSKGDTHTQFGCRQGHGGAWGGPRGGQVQGRGGAKRARVSSSVGWPEKAAREMVYSDVTETARLLVCAGGTGRHNLQHPPRTAASIHPPHHSQPCMHTPLSPQLVLTGRPAVASLQQDAVGALRVQAGAVRGALQQVKLAGQRGPPPAAGGGGEDQHVGNDIPRVAATHQPHFAADHGGGGVAADGGESKGRGGG